MAVVTSLFQSLLGMALAALPVMAVVLAARWLLRRAPKKYSYLLWAVVAFRLICPAALTSPVGLVEPQAAERGAAVIAEAALPETAPPRTDAAVPAAGTPAVQGTVPSPPAASLSENSAADTAGADSAAPAAPWGGVTAGQVLAVVWLAGMAAILAVSLASYGRLRRRLATAVRLRDNIWQADGIATPFVLGWLRPKIYIPFRLTEEERQYVLLHEETHLRRGDPWWKLLAFGLLTAYWWDPAAWLCYFLFCRDMEMSCDERVLRTMGTGIRQAYSLSLVRFAAGGRFPMPSPLAFGEHDAARRVKNVLGWKRARPVVVFLAASLCLLAAVVCGTNAGSDGGWVETEDDQFTYHVSDGVGALSLYEEISVNGQTPAFYYLTDIDLASADGVFTAGFSASHRGGEDRTFQQLTWSVGGSGEQEALPTHLSGSWDTWSLERTGHRRLQFAADGEKTELYRCSLTGPDGTAEVGLYLAASPNDAAGSWVRRSSAQEAGQIRIDCRLGRGVQSMALYLDTYEKDQLISSELQTEVLVDFSLTRQDTLTLRVTPSLHLPYHQESTVRWDVEQGDTVLLRTDQRLGKAYQASVGMNGVPEGRGKTVVRNEGVVLYTLGFSSTSAAYTEAGKNDLTVQLRLVLSSQEQSWVKAEAMKFTCHFTDAVQSMELWEEVYVDGRLTSSRSLLRQAGAALPEDFWFTMDFQDTGSGEDGTTREYGWYYRGQNDRADTVLPCGLPAADYRGRITSIRPENGRLPLKDGRDVILLGQTLWREGREEVSVTGFPANGTAEEQAAAIAAEDAVVLLKLRTDTGTSDYDALAQRLASLWSPNVNDMANTNEILSALTVGRQGTYVPDVPEPGVLRLDFQQRPADSYALDQEMSVSATVLLALIGNLTQVQWSYPDTDGLGQDTQITYYFTQDNTGLTFGDPQAPLLAPYRDLKDCGKSREGLAALLTYLYGSRLTAAEEAALLYDLKAARASADGVEALLRLLDVERWGEHRLDVASNEQWSQLEIYFYQDPGREGYAALDRDMFPKALLLYALIDDLNGVTWSYPYRRDISASHTRQTLLTRQMADSYAWTLLHDPEHVDYYRADLPEDFSVRDCGGSLPNLEALLTAMGWGAGSGVTDLARTLYGARNDPAAILTALKAEESLGDYTIEDSGGLTMLFRSPPVDLDRQNTLIWKYSMVLLALSDRYNATSWNWEEEDGRLLLNGNAGLWNLPQALETVGLTGEIRDYGRSPESLQTLLNALKLSFSDAAQAGCEVFLIGGVTTEAAWYGDNSPGIDSGALPVLTAQPVDRLSIRADWAGDVLAVSEEYYAYPRAGECVIQRKTYTLYRDLAGLFTLDLQRRGDLQDERAVYCVAGQNGRYVFQVDFPQSGGKPFTDILGYDGVRVTVDRAGTWARWVYYGRETDGELRPIGESFGYLFNGNGYEPEAWAVDLDGDGVRELVTNVTFGADGVQWAYVFQRREDGIYLGVHDVESMPDFDRRQGLNAWYTEYDPAENLFRIHYERTGGGAANRQLAGLEGLTFSPWEYLG